MRYSLLSRFQGCWWGLAIGGVCSFTELEQLVYWNRLILTVIKSLVSEGKFDPDNWYLHPSNLNLGKNSGTTADLLIITLPIALYYHENEIKLKRELVALTKQQPTIAQDAAIALGYIIAQSLQEQLNPSNIIHRTIAFIGSDSPIASNLVKVQTLLEQGSGLEMATTELYQTESIVSNLVVAIYCFLSTAEDFRLAILRSARIGAHPITATLTGALAGVHNSTVGIPSLLRLMGSNSDMPDLVEVLELTDKFLAAWSGMYHPTSESIGSVTAIAAPNVIRPTQSSYKFTNKD